jgi:hypothetical protein
LSWTRTPRGHRQAGPPARPAAHSSRSSLTRRRPDQRHFGPARPFQHRRHRPLPRYPGRGRLHRRRCHKPASASRGVNSSGSLDLRSRQSTSGAVVPPRRPECRRVCADRDDFTLSDRQVHGERAQSLPFGAAVRSVSVAVDAIKNDRSSGTISGPAHARSAHVPKSGHTLRLACTRQGSSAPWQATYSAG